MRAAGRRTSRAGARRVVRGPVLRVSPGRGAAASGRSPRPERARARARRTDFRQRSHARARARAVRTSAEARLEKHVNGTETERADGQPLDAVRLERRLELRGRGSFVRAAGEQNVDGLVVHPPQRKRQHARRRRVEPLDVVDGKHDRRLGSESLQCATDCNAERARIRAGIGILDEERDLERAPPRCRQRRQDALEHVLEQVAETGVSEPSLRLGRPRHEDTKSSLMRGLDAGQPDRRLSDPRGALEHECRRSLEAAVAVTPEAGVLLRARGVQLGYWTPGGFTLAVADATFLGGAAREGDRDRPLRLRQVHLAQGGRRVHPPCRRRDHRGRPQHPGARPRPLRGLPGVRPALPPGAPCSTTSPTHCA